MIRCQVVRGHASVVLVARRRDRLEILATEIETAGGTALIAEADSAIVLRASAAESLVSPVPGVPADGASRLAMRAAAPPAGGSGRGTGDTSSVGVPQPPSE